MTYATNPGSASTNLNLSPTSSKTATGNSTGVDLLAYEGEIVILLDSAAASAGTNPTLDITFEESSDDSTYTAISGAAFTQVTNAASRQKMVLNRSALKRYLREVHTIGGTSSPAFTYSVNMLGWKKYVA